MERYVPQSVLRRIAALPTLPDAPVTERSPAALLVVDISGFTALTEAAVRKGPASTERLSRALNSYLGRIVDLVEEYGGDTSKIVGDAVLLVWIADDQSNLAAVARRAAECGLAVTNDCAQLDLENDLRLSLKAGVCAGTIAATHVGGEGGRWLFLVVGEAVSQLVALEPRMRTGQLVASPAAWEQISSEFTGRPVDGDHVSRPCAFQPKCKTRRRRP